MKKKFLILSTILCFAALRISANTEERYMEIVKSPESRLLFSLRQEYINKIGNALLNGHTIGEIKNLAFASAEGNSTNFYIAIFGSNESGTDFNFRYENAKIAFKAAFPEVNTVDINCNTCSKSLSDDINLFFDNFEHFKAISSNFDLDPPIQDGFVCGGWSNVFKLQACMLGCGATGGGLFCGWGCWCSFCTKNSEVANMICAEIFNRNSNSSQH